MSNLTSVSNHELQLAADFVCHTDRHIFLTGKAGTGKTTFLRNLRQITQKQMIITAPTGVAAINANGVTLHSFFQLPFAPFLAESNSYSHNRQRQFRFSKLKKQLIKNLDLLVIDEISMVRSDVLDAVDVTLRRHRPNSSPFGGVQLLLIGDLHQLSPIAKPDEWQILQDHYKSIYFFDSHALARTELSTVELSHIYRQSDVDFIKILNQVRDNQLNHRSISRLNQRYIKNFTPPKDQGYISLTTHNRNAETINQSQLSLLASREYCFKAEVSGDFPAHLYPTSDTLLLKQGAQVMFIRNDLSADKFYYNGKIGKISKISDHRISVICPGDQHEIEVTTSKWENIKYQINKSSGEIEEEITGTFEQYPLKLAWAITIHKSQGLTFEQAIIDVAAAFTHGQVYVALSRCKTLEGIVLTSPMTSAGILTDETVKNFTEQQGLPSVRALQSAKVSYQEKILLECFDFSRLRNILIYLARLLIQNASVVRVSAGIDIKQTRAMAEKDIFEVSENFKRQLQTLFTDETLPESDKTISERISKASVWFQDKFAAVFGELVKQIQIDTDNVELRKKINNEINNFKQEICLKSAGIKCCADGFTPSTYLRARLKAEIDFINQKPQKPPSPVYTEADIAHPELFQTLRKWRAQKAAVHQIAHFQVLYQRVLIQIVVELPVNLNDLRKIKGVGEKTIEKYGEELISLVSQYCREQQNSASTL